MMMYHSTSGGMKVNMSLGIRVMCGIPHCNGDFVVMATDVELYKCATLRL